MDDTALLASETAPAPSVAALFLGFLGVGLMGFGGVLPLSRRMLVEQRAWLNAAEYTELLALCQFLPGGNIINLSVAVGLRFRGPVGAVAAIVGLMAAPIAIVIALGVIYARYEDVPTVRHIFAGLAAAAAGMIAATAVKIALPLRKAPIGIGIAAICLLAVAVLRTPLLPTMLVLAPLSVLITWRTTP